MLQSVLDVLRNEKPVYIYYSQNRGFLTTAKEPVGEGEKVCMTTGNPRLLTRGYGEYLSAK